MAIEIIVPRLGWSMDEGIFSQWLKHDGEYVNEMEELFELESDKAVQAVESFDSGILRISPDAPNPGETVKVGQLLGYLCEGNERPPFENVDSADSSDKQNSASAETRLSGDDDETRNSTSATHSANSDPKPSVPQVAPPSVRRRARELGVDAQSLITNGGIEQLAQSQHRPAADTDRSDAKTSIAEHPTQVRVSPRAARAAAKLGVNLADIRPTGTSGRIRERDVLAAWNKHAEVPSPTQSPPESASQSSPSKVSSPQRTAHKEAKPSPLRQSIASRLLTAVQQTASVTLTSTADATQLVNLRTQFKSELADKATRVPSYTDLFVKLSAAALEHHPEMLAQWSDEGIIGPESMDVAVAVDTTFGLLTPVLRNVPSLPLSSVSDQLHDLVTRARKRRLLPEELRGGCFTVTNLGGYRVDAFTPILNLPQTAILGVGRIRPHAVPFEGEVRVRDCLSLSLTFDHRVVDGATAAALLTTLCEFIEAPLPILLSS